MSSKSLKLLFAVAISVLISSCTKKKVQETTTSDSDTTWGVLLAGATINDAITDSDGNVYITGGTTTAIGSNTQSGTQDLFIAKLNSKKELQWATQKGSAGSTAYGKALVRTSSGEVFVVGMTDGKFGDNPAPDYKSIVLLKVWEGGYVEWIRANRSSGYRTTVHGMKMDSGGNLLVAGETNGILENEPIDEWNSSINTITGFLIKYNNEGSAVWARSLGASKAFGAYGDTKTYSVTLDASDNVFVSGLTYGNFVGETLLDPFQIHYFVAKYNSSGTYQWGHTKGTEYLSYQLSGSTIDPDGNFIGVGYTNEPTVFLSTPAEECYIVKYDTSGNLLWSKNLGAGAETHCQQAVTDSTGNIFISGYTKGGLNGNTLTGTQDFFLAKYTSAGTLEWLKQFGAASSTASVPFLTMNSTRDTMFCGGVATGTILDNVISGSQSGFIMKFNTSGESQ